MALIEKMRFSSYSSGTLKVILYFWELFNGFWFFHCCLVADVPSPLLSPTSSGSSRKRSAVRARQSVKYTMLTPERCVKYKILSCQALKIEWSTVLRGRVKGEVIATENTQR